MRKPHLLNPIVLSLVAAGLFDSAWAADAELALPATDVNATLQSDTGASPGYLGTPTSGTTRLNLTAQETPQGVTSIKREQLEDFKLNSIKDVLRSTPGVNVQQVETDRTYFTARGFDINNVQYDGTGMPLMNGLLVGDIDIAPYEQVDILHGANGLMTGNGNPSATVNLVRKRPTYTPQAQVDMTVGSWDKRQVDIDVSGPLTTTGNVRGRMIYANENGNSYLDRYSREKNIFSGLLAFDLSDDDTLTVGYEDQKSNANGASWGALPLIDGNGQKIHYSSTRANIGQPWVYWDVHTQRAFGEWEHRFANDWTSKLTLTGVEHREDVEMFYMYANNQAADGYTGLGSKYKDKNTELNGDLSLSGPFNLGGREHQLTVGANWARSRNQEASRYGTTLNSQSVTLEDALEGNLARPTFGAALAENTSRYTDRQKSLYAGARFSLADDLHLITGARMLSADSDGENYNTPRNVRVHGKVTPYAGIVYDLTEQYALYASYAEIYNPQYNLDRQGQVLDPLEGKTYETGLKARLLDKKLDVSASLFHTKQDNVAAYVGYDASLGGSLYEGLSYDSSGVELAMSGELAPGLQVNGGYTYAYITDENHDRARLFMPRHALNTSFTYRLPMQPKVKLGGSFSWQSEVAYDSDTTARQEAYALVGLLARYDIDRQWSTQLNVNNLTNEKYLQSLRYGQSNYGDPRNLTASVSWKY